MKKSEQRKWYVMIDPGFDHPDVEILWATEMVAQKLVTLSKQPDIRNALKPRLSQYLRTFNIMFDQLKKKEHVVVFIGVIGSGKTTTICKIANLIVKKNKREWVPVLETGAGGTTVCEVVVRKGNGFGLVIEPRSFDEIRSDVLDFAEYIIPRSVDNSKIFDNEYKDSQVISREVERVIRNMSGLISRRKKLNDGTIVRSDDAKILASEFSSVAELADEIIDRMCLEKRDCREIWYSNGCKKSQLNWLKGIFLEINNGRHLRFSVPKKIEVVVPDSIIGETDFVIKIVDTRGIDNSVVRPDIERYLNDSHTISVLCSSFNNAPATEVRTLLERLMKSGAKSQGTNSILLILPRENEALAVKDETGTLVESYHEGYELKREQAKMAIHQLGLKDYPICFYDANKEEPGNIREFLVERTKAVRQNFRDQLSDLIIDANSLLMNYQNVQIEEVINQAALNLSSWINDNFDIVHKGIKNNFENDLIVQIFNVHPCTVRASIRRYGHWDNLSYRLLLSAGAKNLAVEIFEQSVISFSEQCQSMLESSEYFDAKEFLKQANNLYFDLYITFLENIKNIVEIYFDEGRIFDSVFWEKCMNEWGKGAGYRERVVIHHIEYFKGITHQVLKDRINQYIFKERVDILKKLSTLIESAS